MQCGNSLKEKLSKFIQEEKEYNMTMHLSLYIYTHIYKWNYI